MTVTFLIPSAEGVSINTAEPTVPPTEHLSIVARASGNPCAHVGCAPRYAIATSSPPVICGTDLIHAPPLGMDRLRVLFDNEVRIVAKDTRDLKRNCETYSLP